jgi:hypothetical protein
VASAEPARGREPREVADQSRTAASMSRRQVELWLEQMEEAVTKAKREFGENYERANTTCIRSHSLSVMGELAKSGIQKNNKNTQQGYKFRGIDDVYNALAPLLARVQAADPAACSQSHSNSERETKSGGVLFYVVLDVEFDLVSGTDGSKHTIRVVGEAMDSGDKATNKAMSAAYKYACMEAFCIPTEGDNDADATTHEVTGRGVTVVDPRGENRPAKNQPLVDKWVKQVADLLANTDESRHRGHDLHRALRS